MINLEEYRQKRGLQDEQNQIVAKHNTIIQNARFYLSAQEQKIILYLVSKIKPKDKEINAYEFDIMDFCKACDIDYGNGKNYKNIKQTIQNLSDKSIWVTQENGNEVLYRWIDYAEIIKNTGRVKIKIHDLMKPYLLHLIEQGNYTQYTLYYVLAMKGQYSIKLYEILKSYAHDRHCKFDIDDFKRMIGAEKYQRHPDFMRRVLEPALNEIETFSDIKVSYELHKTGRKFSGISFKIQKLTAMEQFNKRHTNINKKLNKNQLEGQISLYEPEIPKGDIDD